jgi:hypothetical protein
VTELTGKNRKIHEALRRSPETVTDSRAQRLYQNGLNDREMPEEADSFEWACWVAGRRNLTDRRVG